ncbi:MAG: ribose-phosphate pyrophosphokinase [Lentisphaerae bacterium RIFOXYB12_FULL_65_16]|nr:MAG: ribose-phosphate pyrophosphokinase [Lentisphaerae bacterium RIFOXYA12_64_32]OGV91655.1 MAG: ribose-phosphate pyrophosphokinase [Lentisphaerae bacterium RIFOXYB12_FULL_65_16]
MMDNVLVVGVVSDEPFAIDVAHHLGQQADIADVLALKLFANSEYCPRFIRDEGDLDHIGVGLCGCTVIIVSTCCLNHTRNALAMKTCLLARAAKDNGAEHVILVQPDLFYSAQDRGPRPDHGKTLHPRSPEDYKKFDGQPWSAQLYAQLLKTSGVDGVITVHNHSVSVQRLFAEQFEGRFHNLSPADLFAHYLLIHGAGRPDSFSTNFIICAPDRGAAPFADEVRRAIERASAKLLLGPRPSLLLMDKVRSGERKVTIDASSASPTRLSDVAGKDVVVFDDMVRTGNTVANCCQLLKEAGATRVVFVVTHFYSSEEVKENLNHDAIDEIVTTNTLPTVLNRDMQGRLRRKMLVLKIEKWIADFIQRQFLGRTGLAGQQLYAIDVSSKNPRWMSIQNQQS